MVRVSAFVAGLCLCLCPGLAMAQHWEDVAGWTIEVDPALGNGCYLYSNFDGGTQFGIGVNRADDVVYTWISDTDWTSLVAGNTYSLSITFGRRSPWTGDALAIQPDNGPIYLSLNIDSDFIEEFAGQNEVRMNFGPTEIAYLGLQGSRAAVNSMWACQDKWDSMPVSADPFAAAGNADPFAGASGTNTNDPFAQ
jgi:hypothetical protein